MLQTRYSSKTRLPALRQRYQLTVAIPLLIEHLLEWQLRSITFGMLLR